MTRNYSSTAADTTLAAACTAAATTISVTATAGFPAAPYVLALDAGAASQELVLVTGVSGTNLTVARGYDSTLAQSHDTGAVVRHAHGAIDFRESREHEAAEANVHGVTGSVVGTSDTQTLTNKTFSVDSNTINGLNANQFATSGSTGAIGEADAPLRVIPSGTVVGTSDTQTLTNKDLSSASNTFPPAPGATWGYITKASESLAGESSILYSATATGGLTYESVSGNFSVPATGVYAVTVSATFGGSGSGEYPSAYFSFVRDQPTYASLANCVDSSGVATRGTLNWVGTLTAGEEYTVYGGSGGPAGVAYTDIDVSVVRVA